MKRDIIVSILLFVVLFVFCLFSSKRENFDSTTACGKDTKSNSQVFQNSFSMSDNSETCRDIYGNDFCEDKALSAIYNNKDVGNFNAFALNDNSNPIYASHKSGDKDGQLEFSKQLQTTISQARAAKAAKEKAEAEKARIENLKKLPSSFKLIKKGEDELCTDHSMVPIKSVEKCKHAANILGLDNFIDISNIQTYTSTPRPYGCYLFKKNSLVFNNNSKNKGKGYETSAPQNERQPICSLKEIEEAT